MLRNVVFVLCAALSCTTFVAAVSNSLAATNISAHDFAFTALRGGDLSMADFEGKAVLVVNTASSCRYTNQYSGLQTLWESRKDQGLVVLGIPSNDFGNGERGSNQEIKEFCRVNFSINFPMTRKEVVRGDDAHPFYKWAAETYGKGAIPRWNFHKVLIAPDGSVAATFKSRVKPGSKAVSSAIDETLGL